MRVLEQIQGNGNPFSKYDRCIQRIFIDYSRYFVALLRIQLYLM